MMKARRALPALLAAALSLPADPVPARHLEGRIRGFLALRDLEGHILASGTLQQTSNGTRVTSEVSFHFRDGSLQRETTVFSQRRMFRLLSYRLVQKGPAFKRAIDMSIDASTGQVSIQYTDHDGAVKN